MGKLSPCFFENFKEIQRDYYGEVDSLPHIVNMYTQNLCYPSEIQRSVAYSLLIDLPKLYKPSSIDSHNNITAVYEYSEKYERACVLEVERERDTFNVLSWVLWDKETGEIVKEWSIYSLLEDHDEDSDGSDLVSDYDFIRFMYEFGYGNLDDYNDAVFSSKFTIAEGIDVNIEVNVPCRKRRICLEGTASMSSWRLLKNSCEDIIKKGDFCLNDITYYAWQAEESN